MDVLEDGFDEDEGLDDDEDELFLDEEVEPEEDELDYDDEDVTDLDSEEDEDDDECDLDLEDDDFDLGIVSLTSVLLCFLSISPSTLSRPLYMSPRMLLRSSSTPPFTLSCSSCF